MPSPAVLDTSMLPDCPIGSLLWLEQTGAVRRPLRRTGRGNKPQEPEVEEA